MLTLPNKTAVASFDVDAQNTFTPICPNELPVPDGTAIVPELNLQATKAAFRLGSKDAHSPKALWVADADHPQFSPIQGDNMDIRWVRHAEPGTLGFELVKGLPAITQYDYFVWKGIELDMHPYGACYHDFAEKLSTGVIEFCQIKKITTVIVGGLATDYCVKNTVLQLKKANFNVIVNLGACRGIHKTTVAETLAIFQSSGVKCIKSANELSNAT